MSFREKIIGWAELPAWRTGIRAKGLRLVVTNGCFDILHLGHITYLEAARQQGDRLLVGLNSDSSIRDLKGAGRPVNAEDDRRRNFGVVARRHVHLVLPRIRLP